MGDDTDPTIDGATTRQHPKETHPSGKPEDRPARESVNLVGSSTREAIYARAVSTAGSTTVRGDVDAIAADLKGSTTIYGDLLARELDAAGSTTVEGDVTVDSWSSSGSTRVDGSLATESLSTAGSIRVAGDVTSETASFSGSATLADVRAESVSSAGSLAVDTVEAGRIDVAGAVEADDLSATEIDVRLGGAESAVDEIAGERVTIRPGTEADGVPDLDLGGLADWLGELVSRFGVLEPGEARLTAERIEGDVVELEAVTAATVTGETVSLGPGCEIGIVRASELEQHDDATVERFEQLERAS